MQEQFRGKARALDQRTGAMLWEFQLPAALEGMPAIYQAGGREYVVFCAAAQPSSLLLGGNGRAATQGTAEHGAYVAFVLPDSSGNARLQ